MAPDPPTPLHAPKEHRAPHTRIRRIRVMEKFIQVPPSRSQSTRWSFRRLFQRSGVCSAAMILVGLTGGIATGKSTVARMFKRSGAIVLNADQLARDVVRPGRPAWRAIVKAFGKQVLNR